MGAEDHGEDNQEGSGQGGTELGVSETESGHAAQRTDAQVPPPSTTTPAPGQQTCPARA